MFDKSDWRRVVVAARLQESREQGRRADVGRPLPGKPTQNEIRRELAHLCGGSIASTTGPSWDKTVTIYAEAGIVRQWTGQVGWDKEVLAELLRQVRLEGSR